MSGRSVRVRGLAVTLLSCLAAGQPHAAQDHPPFLPTRDLVIEYQVQDARNGTRHTLRSYFTVRSQRLRVETPENPGYMVIDSPGKRILVVMPQARTVAAALFDPQSAQSFMLNEHMRFVRLGTDHVAGFDCTIWDVRSEQGNGRMCMTEDGVMLRGSNDKGSMVATSLRYQPQADELFNPPPGYRIVERPAAANR